MSGGVLVTVDAQGRGRLFSAEVPVGCAAAIIAEACRLAVTHACGSRPAGVTILVSPVPR